MPNNLIEVPKIIVSSSVYKYYAEQPGGINQVLIDFFEKRESRGAYYKSLAQPPDADRDEARAEYLENMLTVFDLYARRLGVNLRRSLPTPEQFHFLDKDNFQKTYEEYGWGEAHSVGYADSHGYMVIKAGKSESKTMSTANHELIHAAQPIALVRELVEEEDGTQYDSVVPLYLGLGTPDLTKGEAATEIFTGMTDVDIRERYWREHPVLAEVSEAPIGYSIGAIIGDELVEQVAKSNDTNWRTIFEHLQRGLLIPRRRALEVVAEYLGPEAFGAFDTWDINIPDIAEAIDNTEEMAERLGLHGAVEKLKAWKGGESVPYMEHYHPSRTRRLMGDAAFRERYGRERGSITGKVEKPAGVDSVEPKPTEEVVSEPDDVLFTGNDQGGGVVYPAPPNAPTQNLEREMHPKDDRER